MALLAFPRASACKRTVTVKDELLTGLEPIGKCLYVYGGGWNKEDTGAGAETMTKGLSPQWEKFYNENDSSYDYKTTRYQIHDGLDCTGYVGWMQYFPEEAAKYQNYLRTNPDYLNKYDEVVWSGSVLSDPDHYREMSAEEILKNLFKNV